LKCNSAKGNKLAGEQCGARRSLHDDTALRTRPEVKSTSNQSQTDDESNKVQGSRSCLGLVPLIPDSLIPDSLIPEEEGGTALRVVPPPTPPPEFDGNNAESLNGKALAALAAAWELPEAWGVDAEALGWKPADVLRESERFRQYWVAGKGAGTRRSVKGWRQSWSNWLGKAERMQR
jgi:hypothetical protein